MVVKRDFEVEKQKHQGKYYHQYEGVTKKTTHMRQLILLQKF